ncbi:LARGE xylosyl- and glucuronyltransferase 2-like [Chrysoperla carnea]|uniref:LARGE xylosyl- and glucuronyltransferase 2-like n=1 Tax=Chrysoperla carnea TaxID=189513 RepID=UPI001D09043A|nr:LARGE xylosyl- and glucuronyltransferase 2-like [Chrysoperla carnea]
MVFSFLINKNVFPNGNNGERNLEHKNYKEHCEIIHVGLVCAGYNSSRIIVTLFKSILFHRRNPIHFHLMVDRKADKILKHLFNSWMLPEVKVTFYQAENYVKLVEWIPNKHYSGVFGLLKLLFPQILSKNLSKIITLDTDVTILTDIAQLWKQFDNFTEEQAIGLVENQSNWYYGKLWNNYKPWPAIGRGFNTGVMLLDINKLNNHNWTMLWRLTAAQYLGTYGSTGLADQDILNAIITNNPQFLFRLPCFWNVQLGDNTLSGSCYHDIIDIKIIHWNSPRKLEVENKDGNVLRVLYQTFLEYNGNFLRAPKFSCDNSTKNYMNIEPDSFDDECDILKEAQKKVWRTHLFIVDFDYEPSLNGNDVTLVTQLSFDRIQMIEQICNHWIGPASFTFYATDSEVQYILNYIQSIDVLKYRKNIAYHVVYKDGDVYPVNYLRNVGLQNVNTPFVFLTDIDFLPMNGLYLSLKRYILKWFTSYKDKKALVIPAFETQRYRFSYPQTKDQLLNMLNQSMLFTFRYHVWTKGHESTNYKKWKTATLPYKIQWQPDFEPYVVIPNNRDIVPLYDTRFVGFGWNKVSHIMELNALQYEFIVLPDCYTIHLPHAPSYDIVKFRHSTTYRRCLKVFKDEFIRELKRKYSNTEEATASTVVPATTMN